MTAFANALKTAKLSLSERQLAFGGLARGAVIFIGFTLGMALISGIIAIVLDLANLGLPVAIDLELGLLAGFTAAISAAAMTPNLLASSFDGSVDYFDILGAIPILVWLMFVVLRGVGREFVFADKVQSARQIWILALSVATGFIGLAAISSLGLAASHANAFFFTSLEAVNLGDAVVSGFFISAVVGWAANQKRRELAGMPSGIGDLLGRFFGTLMAAWSTLITLAVIYLILFLWLEPDFAEAVRVAERASSGTLSWSQIATVLAALLVVFILSPALLFYFFAITMGASFSLEVSSGSLDLADLIGNLARFLPGGIGNEFSIFQISQLAGVALILLVFFVSIFAATAASIKTEFAITKKHEIFAALGFVATVLFFLGHFFGFGVSSTNRGSLPQDLASGGIPLIEERVLIGVTGGGLTLLWLVVATGLYLGAGPFRRTFTGAYPGLIRVFGKKIEAAEERLLSRILSIASIAVLAIATTVPMTIAAIERVWASIDNPVQLADKLFEEYQSATVSNLKGFTKSTNPWLNEKALDAAREIGDSPVSSMTLNNIGEKWKVGDIEVVTSYLVGEEDQSYMVDITNTGTVRSYWEIDHPQFKTMLVPGLISFTGPDELEANEDFSFSVNGQKASFGTFQVVPGTYRVESTELGMISAIDHTFRVSSDQTLTIDFSDYLSIPDQAQRQIESTLNGIKTGCSSIDNLTPGDCPAKQQFNDALQLVGDSVLNGGVLYLELEVSDWENVGLTVTDQNVDFTQQCTAIRTEVTALASTLPDGVEPSLFSSVSWMECDYSYFVTRTFEDANGIAYPVELFGESTFLYYIEGEVSEESGEFTANRLRIVDKTEYPE